MNFGTRQQNYLDALKSGKFHQGKFDMCRIDTPHVAYCALGLALEMANKCGLVGKTYRYLSKTWDYGKKEEIDKILLDFLRFKDVDSLNRIIRLNDTGRNFLEIAEAIEADVEEFFKEPI